MDPTTAAVAGLIAEIIKQGVLGIVIAALLTGYLVPKWVRDEMKAREDVKDEIIERQAKLIERWAAREATRPRIQIPEPPESKRAGDDLDAP